MALKTDYCVELLDICPEPTMEDIENIASKAQCSIRTVYRAIKKREGNLKKIYGARNVKNGKVVKNPKKRPGPKRRGPDKKKKSPTQAPKHLVANPEFDKKKFEAERQKILAMSIDEKAEHFKKFVGYVDNNGVIHRGEAFPPPITKKGKYLGILDYELEAFKDIQRYNNNLKKWPRKHGKTYVDTWNKEWEMKYLAENWMHFSVTRIRKKVGNWIYRWAKNNKLLRKAERNELQNSYTRFELKNGAEMQIHDYMQEEFLGEHGFNISMDDIVKRKWKNKPSELQKAIDNWKFNINYVDRKKLVIWGTRKFPGDLLEYLGSKIDNLHIEKKSPFLPCPHGNLNEYGTFDPCDICRDLCLLAPELHSYDELMKKREEDLESWYAEEMQDPRPLIGKFKKYIAYADFRKHWTEYDLATIDVDAAETSKKTSSLTGIVVKIRETGTLNYLVINDLSDHYEFDEKLEIIDKTYKALRVDFPKSFVKIIIEKQGGGNDLISSAKSRGYKFASQIIEVQNTRDKKDRIKDYLGGPLRTGQIKFLRVLRNSELIKEIETFPNCVKLDAIDALATGIKECETIERGTNPEEKKALANKLKQRVWQRELQSQVLPQNPLEKLQKRYNRRDVY